MPLVRFKIRNELSLGDPELNRSAAVEDEEPKAILGTLEVAGLIGILRQLGDLAEFSAEVFSGIQEEVTVTASRCQKLTSRVRRIESALSPLEKAVLSQTSHIHFAYTAGSEWHPRIRNGHSHFVQSDLPLCVMESYEQCRDPPPLHLLDRFAVGGPGSCLRKYSDPTFFRKDLSNPNKADDVKVQKDQAHCKRKTKRLPQRSICRSNAVSTSDETYGAHLGSLTDDRQTTSQSTSTVDMPRSSNLQDLSDVIDQSHLQGQSDAQEQSEALLQSDIQESSKARDSITGSGYIEYVINQSPVDKPEVKLVEGFLSGSLQPADRISSAVPKRCSSEDLQEACTSIVCDEKKETFESVVDKSSKDEKVSEVHEAKFGPGTPDRVRQNQRDFGRTYILFDEVDIVGEKQRKSLGNSIDGTLGIKNEEENKSEQGSDTDEFVDARNTIESESESDLDGTEKPKLEHYFGDISTYCSEDAISDNNDGSEDIPYEQMAHDPHNDNSLNKSSSRSYFPEDASVSCYLLDPVCGKTLPPDETFQKPRGFFPMRPYLLAKEAFPDVMALEKESVAALTGDCANEKIPCEETSCPSLKVATPAGNILPEEHLANYPSFKEAEAHEKILSGQSVVNNPSYVEVVTHEEILPKKYLPNQYLAEAVPNNTIWAEVPDAANPSFPKAVQDNKVSAEVLYSNKHAQEANSQEQILLEEYVGIYPCLTEAISDGRFLTGKSEEPAITSLSLTKTMPTEELVPEKPLEVYHYLAELPKDKTLLNKSVDSTHLSCAKAPPEANLSPEVSDSTKLSVADSDPQEKISPEEFVGIKPCLVKAVTDETLLPEEPITTSLSLTEAVTIKKVLPEHLLESYPSLAELPEERILQEETDDAIHPSEAGSDEEISAEVFASTNLSVEPQEHMSLNGYVVINPCVAEAVPDERFLPEEPVTTYLTLEKVAAMEGVLPEEPVTTCLTNDATRPFSEAVSDKQISSEFLDSKIFFVAEAEDTYHSLGHSEEKILHEETNDAIHHFLSEAVSDKHISSELLDSKYLSVAEAALQENISLEELNCIDSCLAEAVPDKKVLPEEPVTTCMSLTKVVPIEEILPEEPSEALEKLPKDKISQDNSDGATHPFCAQGENEETISPGILDSASLSVPGEQVTLEEFVGIDMCLAEAIPHEQIALEEFVGMDSCLEEAFSDKRVLPKEPVTTCLSFAKDAPSETIFLEPLDVYPSLKVLTEEKISQAEASEDPFLSEAVNDENIVPLETLGFTYRSLEESVLYENTTHGELVGTNPFLELAVPNERSFTDEPYMTHQLLAETVSEEKNLPEEPLPTTYPSLAEVILDEKISLEETNATYIPSVEAVFNEKIQGSEAPDSTTETALHNKTLSEEPVTMDLSLPEAVFDVKIPGSNAPGSTTETGPHIKTFPEEPVAMDLSLPEAVFDEKIPDSNAPDSTTETGPHNKTFPEEPVAMDLSSTKAVFDEKIPVSEAPSFTTETGPHNKTLPEEPVPNNNILPKEPAATYLALAEGIPDQKVFLDDAALLLFAEAIFDQKFSPEVPDTTSPSVKEPEMPASPPSLVTELPSKNVVLKEGEAYDEPYTGSDVSMNQNSGFSKPESADRTIPSSGGTVTVSPDTQESPSNGTSVEPVSIWSNGGLLGLAPLKPPVFAEPNSVSTHIQNEINETSVPSTRKQKSSSQLIDNSEKSSLPLVVSDPTSQQHSRILSPAHLQSTATSFKVFGLSHRLLMAGFRGNSSSTCKFESIPTSYDTRVATIEDKTQHTHGGSSFEEQLDYESSLLGSPSSSPPVEHMKISFNPMDASPVANLKLRIPCQPQYNGENVDMFPSFQLVPDTNNSDDDDNSDTFCQSSPCVSVNCLSDSELWESDESPRKSVSSLKQVEERSTHADMGSFSGSFLDLPCYDTVYHQSTSSRVEREQEEEQCPEYKPSVSEIIRDWPPIQPKNSTSSKANTNAVLEKTQHQSLGLLATDDEG